VSDFIRRRALQSTPWRYPLSTVVYSGVDTRLFPPAPIDDARPWRWRLVFAGRFDPRKGAETAIRSLPHLPEEAELALYGRGGLSERNRLAAVASELGIAGRVRFDEVTRDELATVYRDADAVVFPSEWEEPFGLIPLEAMACATPVAATATGGSGEFLFDGQNCVTFSPGQPAALAAALARLSGDAALRRTLVEGGLRTVAQLDADRLTDVVERWLVAAASGYREGPPDDREPVRLDGR
jgi:glycosyltransferase involved in cell wall biosynthesis